LQSRLKETVGDLENLQTFQLQIDAMRWYIKKRLVDNPNLVVSVTFSGETSMESYIAVLHDLKAAGAKRICVSGPTLDSWTIQKYK